MARSVGEAAALGLESGYRLATDIQDRKLRQERQAQLDAQAADQQSYVRGRQARADKMAALGLQGQALTQEGLALALSNPDQATQQAFAEKVGRFQSAQNAELSQVSGFNLEEQTKLGQDEIVRLQNGDVEGINLARATAVSTGRPHTDYQRVDGQPAPVEQAAEMILTGMESGDQGALLKGINAMYAPEMRAGVGSKSPHGGTIVAKQIIGLDKLPNSHPDDPHFVPRIRVYVNSGKEMRGPLPEGVPPGATGYYDAPLTKNRSSDPNDPVRPVGLNETMDWLHKQQEIVEALNTPEAQQKLAQDAERGDFDPRAYMQALAAVGAAGGGAKKIAYHSVPAGGSLLKTTTDAKGNVISEERIEGNPKPASDANPLQKKIDAIKRLATDDGGNLLTKAEADAKVKDLVGKETTRAPRSSGGGGGGAGGTGGKIHKTEKDGEGYLIGVFKDGSTRRLLVDGKPIKSMDFEKRIDKIAHDMSQGLGGLGKSTSELRDEARKAALDGATPAEATKPAEKGKPGGLSKEDAAKKFGF